MSSPKDHTRTKSIVSATSVSVTGMDPAISMAKFANDSEMTEVSEKKRDM